MTNWPVQTQTHRTEQTHSGHKDATNIRTLFSHFAIFIFIYDFLNYISIVLSIFYLFSIHSAWYVDAKELCATPSDIALVIDGSRSIWEEHFKLQVGLKTQTLVLSECLLRLGVIRVLCCSVCLFLYRPFCHGSLKLDTSTLFTIFFL